MDLLKILDSPPEPSIIDPDSFFVDAAYANSNDFKILTPLTDFQKELFDQIVSLHYSDILKFYIQYKNENGDLKDQLIIDSLRVLLQNSLAVSNHPYLLIDHFFPKNLTSRDMHKKLAETSGKFAVLNDLLNIIEGLYVDAKKTNGNAKSRNQQQQQQAPAPSATNGTISNNGENFNLVIVAPAGKCTDLIESLLLGHHCRVKRYSGEKLSVNSKSKKQQLQQPQQQQAQQQQPDGENAFVVHLLPSDSSYLNKELYEKELVSQQNLHLLISFDISTNLNEEYISNLVAKNAKIPTLRLVPNNTIEHIALFFRKSFMDKNDTAYLKPVTAAIVCLRDRVGLIPSELRSIYATNLKYLTDWFKQLAPSILLPSQVPLLGKEVPWPLPDLRPIDNFHSYDVEKSLLKEVKFENDEDELLQLPNHYKTRPKTKISYYKSQRLESSYLTNPLEYQSYNKITGISSNIPENTSILTHKLILNCNLTLHKNGILDQELETFKFIQKVRDEDLETCQSQFDKISKDVAELQAKIDEQNNKLQSRQVEIDEVKAKAQDIETNIAQDPIKAEYLSRKELTESIENKTANKKQENEYMQKEIEKAQQAIQESQSKIDELQKETLELRDALNKKTKPHYSFDSAARQTDKASALAKTNSDLQRVLEKSLKKIGDIPISQKLRINGVNNNIYAGHTSRR